MSEVIKVNGLNLTREVQAAQTAVTDAEAAQTAAETARAGAEAAETGAVAAKAGAETARDEAVAIVIADADEAMATAIETPGSQTASALTASYGWTIPQSVESLTPEQQTTYLRDLFNAVRAGEPGVTIHLDASMELAWTGATVSTRGSAPNNEEDLLILPCNGVRFTHSPRGRIKLSEATAPSAAGRLIFALGTEGEEVRDVLFTWPGDASEQAIGGGSIWWAGRRRTGGDSSAVDNVVAHIPEVLDCRIGWVLSNSTQAAPAVRPTRCHARIGRVETDGNRGVELHAVDGGSVTDTDGLAAASVVHVAPNTRHFKVSRSGGTCTVDAVRVNLNCSDIDLRDNHVAFEPTAESTGGGLAFHTEPVAGDHVTERIRSKNNTWPAPVAGTYRRALTFHVAPEATSVTWNDIESTNDVFEGDVKLYPGALDDPTVYGKGHVNGLVLNNPLIKGSILTVEHGNGANQFDQNGLQVNGGRIVKQVVVRGTGAIYRGVTLDLPPLVDETAVDTTFDANCRWPGFPDLVNNGTGTVVAGVALADPVAPPTLLDPTSEPETVYVFDDSLLALADGANLGTQTSAADPLSLGVTRAKAGTTDCTVATDAGSGRKVVQFNAAAFARLVTPTFAAAQGQPLTYLLAFKPTNTGAAQWLLAAGSSTTQPRLQIAADGRVFAYSTTGTGGGWAQEIGRQAVTWGAWNVLAVQFFGDFSRGWVNELTHRDAALTEVDATTRAVFGASGSAGSPYYSGQEGWSQLIAAYTPTDRIQSMLRFLADEFGVSLSA